MTLLADQVETAGIVPRGAQVLRSPSRRLVMPDDTLVAQRLLARLGEVLDQLASAYAFTKGSGIAAPQIGVGRAVAVVRTPGGAQHELVNPRIVGASSDLDDQYEGCLSFFSVRGLVPRPLWIEVETDLMSGPGVKVRRYERADARLVCHEMDHLLGVLYVDRMAVGEPLVPAADCPSAGVPWQYRTA